MTTLRGRLAAVLCCAVAALAALVGASTASADFGFQPGSFTVTTSTQQAGAHPDLTTSFSFNTKDNGSGTQVPAADMKDVNIDLPAGMVGSAAATPRCEPVLLESSSCPPSTQVGMVTIPMKLFLPFPLPLTVAVYNLVPDPGDTAMLGFAAIVTRVHTIISVRPGDYGLRATLHNVSQAASIYGATMTLWGVPASPVHDGDRGGPAGIQATPFLTNPTTCGAGPVARISATAWQLPGADPVTDAYTMAPTTGCDRLHFDPSLDVRPQVEQVDSPSGYEITMKVPQNDDPAGLATADLRKAVVKLPAGVTLNPAVADGLQACSDGQLGLGSATAPTCPGGSTLGSADLVTPALPDPLRGAIYLRPQLPGDPYRIALVMSGDGVMIKLPGSVTPDPQTGQLTTTFDDAPQQPFSELTLRFKGGDRAPLTTPTTCGAATTAAMLSPWSVRDASADVTPTSSSFDASWDGSGAPCPAVMPFTPGLVAGVTDPSAGASSPFTFRVTRADRQQTLGQISGVHLPAGLTANVNGVPLCGAAAAAAGTCAATSQIGTALVGSGAGGHPLYLNGKVFLTEGYKGAPFGLSIAVPAIAGPFDLGTVVVRAAVKVNPDASLTIDADPLPTMLQGVPLRLRDIVLNMDRPGFMLNPTSCAPASIGASVVSAEGATAPVSNRFQITGCGALGFRPRITATTDAGNSRTKGASLHVTVRGLSGDANLRTVRFTLPAQMGANLNTTKNACVQADYDAGRCSPLAKVGTAKAVTGILPEPMAGDVYLVAQSHGLPKLQMLLRGNGIDIPLSGAVSFSHNRTVTTFDAIPDVPITRFDLDLPMGSTAAVVSTVNVCRAKLSAPTRAIGQNGKVLSQSTRVAATGCGRHAATARRAVARPR